ncbi:MBL fold metallo-hydrolase [Vulcanisaeta thermophila]|uniref:MBL fold metallo-hydrolase n=1 Tax=Vulcanisaeta thermophila TaxID=867917 RepID=UPI000853353F|nr:MBL fold metallo-hydrolase [Vulcanisaeta thermophila]
MVLQKLTENVYLIPGRTNVGIVRVDNEYLIIDTGIDDDHGRKILNTMKDTNLRIRAVINTHHHADHIGGNAIIHRRTNAPIYVSDEDRAFVEIPLLEPLYLYGAFPPKALRNKFLEAQGVPTKSLEELVRELNLSVVRLPGHTLGMIGIMHEGVLFTADAFFPHEVLIKYGIPYHLDVRSALKSLGNLINMVGNAKYVVPAHGSVLSPQDAINSINENVALINRIKDSILGHVGGGEVSLDDLVSMLLREFSGGVDNLGNYLLNRSTILSYITWLSDDGYLEPLVRDGRVLIRGLRS